MEKQRIKMDLLLSIVLPLLTDCCWPYCDGNYANACQIMYISICLYIIITIMLWVLSIILFITEILPY